MIGAHLEPKGLAPDAIPLADHRAVGWAKANAVNGSARLRDAILRTAGGPTAPRRWRVTTSGAVTSAALARVRLEAAAYFGINLDEMVGSRGPPKTAGARQIAMYVARETTAASYPDIGMCFGGRDHSTVVHACQRVGADPAALRHAAELVRRLAE